MNAPNYFRSSGSEGLVAGNIVICEVVCFDDDQAFNVDDHVQLMSVVNVLQEILLDLLKLASWRRLA